MASYSMMSSAYSNTRPTAALQPLPQWSELESSRFQSRSEKEFNYEFVCLVLEGGGLERNERGVKDETLMISLGKLDPSQQCGDRAKRGWEAWGKY